MPTCDFDPQPACFWHRAPTGRSEYPDGMTPCEPPAFEHAMLPPNVAAEFDQVYATIRLLEARIGELEAKFEGAPTVGLVPGGEPKPGDAKPSVDFNALFDAATLQAQERQPERSTPCPSKS